MFKTRLMTLSLCSLVIITILILPRVARATVFDDDADGNWDIGTTWGGDCASSCVAGTDFPGSSDTAIIDSHTVTQNVAIGVTSFVQTSGTFTGATQDIIISGDLYLLGGTFTSTSGNLSVGGTWSSAGFTHGSGTITLNGSGAQTLYPSNTTNGTDVAVTNLYDPATGQPDTDVNLTFSNVSAAGDTIVVQRYGAAVPGDFEICRLFSSIIDCTVTPVPYTIITTATFSGTVTPCIHYSQGTLTTLQEARLELYKNIAGTLNKITLTRNTTTNIICGSTTALSAAGTAPTTGDTFHNLTINNSASSPDDDTDVDPNLPVTVSGTLTVTDGQWTAFTGDDYANVSIGANGILKPDSGASLTVSGNWTNSGTFTNNSGTITLDGTSQSVSGSSNFYNLTKSVGTSDTLTFGAGSTQTITNNLTLTGVGRGLLSLRSSNSGTRWSINPSTSRSISYVNVRDSVNNNAVTINCSNSNCENAGNNINWDFGATSLGGRAANFSRLSASSPTLSGTNVSSGLTAPSSVGTISRSLRFGSNGSDVRWLQRILNADPETRVAVRGPGSLGQETNAFGPLTVDAVRKFQVKRGISGPGQPGYGLVDSATLAELNKFSDGARIRGQLITELGQLIRSLQNQLEVLRASQIPQP